MPEYYYQIKGKRAPEQFDDIMGIYNGNWVFPPIFTGKVEAENKNDAKIQVEQLYGKKFPMRVLAKDLDSNDFLLSLDEIKPGSHIARLFEPQICQHCENTFYVIDKYNDGYYHGYKGPEFCSNQCKLDARDVKEYLRAQFTELSGNQSPVIYKIMHKVTGMVYIGKTTQVFTLRWYQHFFQRGTCKFHEAIKNSKISDWNFEIIEIVMLPQDVKTVQDIEKIILERERHWISHYNSIQEGYNSI